MTSTIEVFRALLGHYPCRAAAPLRVQWELAELEAAAEVERRRLRAGDMLDHIAHAYE